MQDLHGSTAGKPLRHKLVFVGENEQDCRFASEGRRTGSEFLYARLEGWSGGEMFHSN